VRLAPRAPLAALDREVSIVDLLPLHPRIVHMPIALAVLIPIVSLGLIAAWWRGLLPRRVWSVVVFLQLLLVAGGFTAMRTGQSEEDRVERVVSGTHVHAHEEAAEAFVWGGVVVLALVIAAAVPRAERPARFLAVAAFAGTLVVLFLGYRTGEAGGRLVYTHGAASAYASPSGAGGEQDH
jgi:uncharacterized membrane protein